MPFSSNGLQTSSGALLQSTWSYPPTACAPAATPDPQGDGDTEQGDCKNDQSGDQGDHQGSQPKSTGAPSGQHDGGGDSGGSGGGSSD